MRILVNGSRRRILSLYVAAVVLWAIGAVVEKVLAR